MRQTKKQDVEYTKTYENTLCLLNKLNLKGIKEHIVNMHDNNCMLPSTALDYLFEFLQVEEVYQKNELAMSLIRKAKLKDNLELSDIHIDEERGTTADLITQLKSLEWYTKSKNCIITGKSGVGKTALACAMGRELCKNGISTLFLNLPDLFASLEAKNPKQIEYFKSTLKRYKCLILDEFGMSQINPTQLSLLQYIMKNIEKTGVVILTSQVQIKSFGEVLPTGINRDSFIDRLIRPSYSIVLNGNSMRGKFNTTLSLN